MLDNNVNASEQEQKKVITVLKEFQSITQYLFIKYDGTVESLRKIETMWDENIGLQPDRFDEHHYYRAIYAYYLTLYSSAPDREGLVQKWSEIDYKNKFGHRVYDFVKCREALKYAAQENPSYVEKIEKLIHMYAYVSGKDISEDQLKNTWMHAVKKDKLTEEQDSILHYLYGSELTKLWELLFAKYQKDKEKRFDLYWDKTFWLQKNPKSFQEHRYYRQFICTFISDFASEKNILDESDEMVFAIEFSDYVGCNVLNTQNYYEHPWYKRLEKKRRRVLKKKNVKGEQKEDPLEIFDQRNLG